MEQQPQQQQQQQQNYPPCPECNTPLEVLSTQKGHFLKCVECFGKNGQPGALRGAFTPGGKPYLYRSVATLPPVTAPDDNYSTYNAKRARVEAPQSTDQLLQAVLDLGAKLDALDQKVSAFLKSFDAK